MEKPPETSIKPSASDLLELRKFEPKITGFEAAAGSMILCIPDLEKPPPT